MSRRLQQTSLVDYLTHLAIDCSTYGNESLYVFFQVSLVSYQKYFLVKKQWYASWKARSENLPVGSQQ
jgi:hypothetical protein